ncbi:hypothetical protein L226DRAFT_124577 [Lentinus tigrinus ALCF2SS1-7]|uniref:Uncharacterized protein n=1 Tax=Lentinus tigrinus ALCF2SS1-6 TaxID=1328759 RepID=A0A5C2SSV6_9APHY|nr:hypothetical protein L227DRAFT_10428 [Lentinus tigrinus ALCF2SS1-6]RPD80926.1 hypothetical protein L226DRAFT_124577 [Lentinus tigrinus ALCF2SS1-7]
MCLWHLTSSPDVFSFPVMLVPSSVTTSTVSCTLLLTYSLFTHVRSGSRRGFTFSLFHAPSDRKDALYPVRPSRLHISPSYPRPSPSSSSVLHRTPPDASICSRSVRDVRNNQPSAMLFRFASRVFLSYVTYASRPCPAHVYFPISVPGIWSFGISRIVHI